MNVKKTQDRIPVLRCLLSGALAGAANGLFGAGGGNVWAQTLPYLIGGIIGGLLSARLFARVPAVWLHRAFGLLILYGGIKAVMLW